MGKLKEKERDKEYRKISKWNYQLQAERQGNRGEWRHQIRSRMQKHDHQLHPMGHLIIYMVALIDLCAIVFFFTPATTDKS